MQSMPEFSSIIKFTNAEDRTINSSVMRLHERATLGDEHLSKYTNDYAGLTNNLSKFAYFSQVMQAYAMERAIVTLRGNKPYCMGSLYWQLNDVWPVSSWSTIDYYGTYKIAQYRVRELHSQLLIHVVHAPKTNRTS
jgi:beta-mannosidase